MFCPFGVDRKGFPLVCFTPIHIGVGSNMDDNIGSEFFNFKNSVFFFLDVDFFNIPSEDFIIGERGKENTHQISAQHSFCSDHQYPLHLTLFISRILSCQVYWVHWVSSRSPSTRPPDQVNPSIPQFLNSPI